MSTISPLPDHNIALMQASQARLHTLTRTFEGNDNTPNMRRIDESAQDFEAMFLSELIKPMFENLEVDAIFGGGKGEEVFRDLLTQEYGKKMAESGGIGIAKFVRDELIRQQEASVK